MVLARITQVPHIGKPSKRTVESKEVKIIAKPMPEAKPDIVPLWIIVLSAIVGVIILLLLIYLLYKVTMFGSIFLLSKTNVQSTTIIIYNCLLLCSSFSVVSSSVIDQSIHKSDNH